MGKTLVVVESPGKVKKIASILGSGFVVEASIGHVRDLPANSMGVEAPSYKPMYAVSDRGKGVLAKLRKAVQSADQVLLATDPDREGEAIAWHLADALKLRSPRRISFQAITPAAVKAAIAAPRGLDMDLVHAQEARRVLDRLVGYSVSPVLSDLVGERALSAGRVQSPAVRLVVERERAIRAFKPTKHFGVELVFPGSGGEEAREWKALWNTKSHLPEGQEYFTNEAFAGRIAAVRDVRVMSFEDGEAQEPPRPAFTTSTLQQEASAKLKLKPKMTMDLAQRLYEQGAITYHRTDSLNLAVEACGEIEAFARGKGLELPEKRRRWKSKEGAQEAHEAIRPTHIEVTEAGETESERALYKLIWARTLASQLADAVYAVRTATLEALEPVEGQSVSFTARGRTLRSKGWRAVYETQDEDAEEPGEANNPVPVLSEGQRARASDGRVLAKTTKPPTRFKQATLVKELEKRGIGRPSTYAAILENITGRGYIGEDAKGYLSPKPAGELIVDALVGKCTFIDLEYTRELEEQLDAIADKRAGYRETLAVAHSQLQAELGTLGSGTAHPCPTCGKAMRRREGRSGWFWGCSGYPDCRTTLPDADGKPGQREAAQAQPAAKAAEAEDGVRKEPGQLAHPCPACGKAMRRREGKNGWFWGCSGYPDCRTTLPDADGKPGQREAAQAQPAAKAAKARGKARKEPGQASHACPTCGKAMRRREGKNGWFWGCSGYPDCRTTLPDADGKPGKVPKRFA